MWRRWSGLADAGGRFMLEVAAWTHRGKVRERNEDTIVVGDFQAGAEGMEAPRSVERPLDPPVLCLVADGMGGHAAGEKASSLAARLLAERIGEDDDDLGTGTAKALRDVNRAVYEAAAETPGARAMGTTVAGMLFAAGGIRWFNVGDSRIYRYRNGFARQLSIDDVPPEAPRSGRITQALGGWSSFVDIEPHVGREELNPGWRYLLCSDGLTDHLDVRRIEEILAEGGTDADAATRLFDCAMEDGGRDNISIVLARVLEGDAPRGEEPA